MFFVSTKIFHKSHNQFKTFLVLNFSTLIKKNNVFLQRTNIEKHLNCSYRALCTWSYSQDYIVPVRREKKPCWLYELKINDSKQFCPRLQGKSKYSVDITSLYRPFPPLCRPTLLVIRGYKVRYVLLTKKLSKFLHLFFSRRLTIIFNWRRMANAN